MTFALHTAIRETATAPGTASFALNGAIDDSYFAFADLYADGDTMHYVAKGEAGREIGIGTLNDLGGGDWELQRTTIIKSTNSGATVNFLAGTVDISVTNVGPSSLSSPQLAQLAHTSGAMTYADAQSLTDDQKAQIRTNFESLFWPTGRMRPMIDDTASMGWISLDDGTIGDALSGASTRANNDCLALFTKIFDKISSDTYAPIFTSSGTSTTRSAQVSAAAAWAAHCRISLPRIKGRVVGGAGAGSGLSTRVLGQFLGSENHALSISELPVITPAGSVSTPSISANGSGAYTIAGAGIADVQSGSGTSVPFSPGAIAISASSTTPSFTGTPFGSGTAHDLEQATTYVAWEIKL